MTLSLLIVLLWHVFATLGFTVIYQRYLPVQVFGGPGGRTVSILSLSVVSAILLYQFMAWVFA
ncbi:hypothetical protein [Dankookia rubra]|uniref:hypothetical protein n=1 Tax=Dankookia rubra TaxID=1442381 RepID=UPI00140D0255|nr:hypothetical protein [Dankookia rubra]